MFKEIYGAVWLKRIYRPGQSLPVPGCPEPRPEGLVESSPDPWDICVFGEVEYGPFNGGAVRGRYGFDTRGAELRGDTYRYS